MCMSIHRVLSYEQQNFPTYISNIICIVKHKALVFTPTLTAWQMWGGNPVIHGMSFGMNVIIKHSLIPRMM